MRRIVGKSINKKLTRAHKVNYTRLKNGYKDWGETNLKLSEPYGVTELDDYIKKLKETDICQLGAENFTMRI